MDPSRLAVWRLQRPIRPIEAPHHALNKPLPHVQPSSPIADRRRQRIRPSIGARRSSLCLWAWEWVTEHSCGLLRSGRSVALSELADWRRCATTIGALAAAAAAAASCPGPWRGRWPASGERSGRARQCENPASNPRRRNRSRVAIGRLGGGDRWRRANGRAGTVAGKCWTAGRRTPERPGRRQPRSPSPLRVPSFFMPNAAIETEKPHTCP